MPSFKVEMWEQVTVWQRVKVVISADSEEALHEKIKSNYEILANWEDSNA